MVRDIITNRDLLMDAIEVDRAVIETAKRTPYTISEVRCMYNEMKRLFPELSIAAIMHEIENNGSLAHEWVKAAKAALF